MFRRAAPIAKIIAKPAKSAIVLTIEGTPLKRYDARAVSKKPTPVMPSTWPSNAGVLTTVEPPGGYPR